MHLDARYGGHDYIQCLGKDTKVKRFEPTSLAGVTLSLFYSFNMMTNCITGLQGVLLLISTYCPHET